MITQSVYKYSIKKIKKNKRYVRKLILNKNFNKIEKILDELFRGKND